MSSAPVPDAATSSGAPAAAGTGRRRNRGSRGKGGGAGTSQAATKHPSKPAFKGDIADMNGHVFECIGERATRPQFTKTVEMLHTYVKMNMTYPEDLAALFQPSMSAPSLTEPERPTDTKDPLAVADYVDARKTYNKHVEAITGNYARLFSVIWGQSSESMRSKLKAVDGWTEAFAANDCFWLLQQIRAIALNFDHTKKLVWSLQEAKLGFLSCTQTAEETVEVYMENVRAWAEAIESYGGSIVEHSQPATDVRTRAAWERAAREESLAMALIRGADNGRFRGLKSDLANSMSQGRDYYPIDFTSAYSFLANYKPTHPVPQKQNSNSQNSNRNPPAVTPPAPAAPTTAVGVAPEVSAMTFAQVAVPGDDGNLFPNITCDKCKRPGHFANHCPPVTGTTLVQHGFTLVQHGFNLAQAPVAHTLDPNCILLDSQSTVSVIKNPAMLSNIRPSRSMLRVITNGGSQESTQVGDFANLGEVWYNPESIANILSLADVRKVCRITMDTHREPALIVHRVDGSEMKFVESPTGLYIYSPPNVNQTIVDYSLLQTVAQNRSHFTKREVAAADAARALYRKIGRPSEEEFQRILRSNLIRNCPVTPDDAKRALIIYGPDIATVKGTRRHAAAAARVPSFLAVPLPPPILEYHRDVTICADFFFVQQIPFYHSISRKIGYRTASYCAELDKKTILRESRAVTRLYEARGFRVRDFHCDNAFECIRSELLPIHLDVVPADSHVCEVENSVKTVKHRVRSAVHGLPYKRLPKLMVIELVHHAMRCLNQFPWKNGISSTMSPNTIVTGAGLPDFHGMSLEFGSYCQVYEDNHPKNTIRARTLGAIALGPTGNAAGDYAFMSLASGDRITRHDWVELPIPDTAIARVEALALHQKQPPIQKSGLVVEWRPDMPIDDDEYDADYFPKDLSDEALDDDFLPIDRTEILSLADPTDDPSLPGNAQGAPTAPLGPYNYYLDYENDNTLVQPPMFPTDDQGAQHDTDLQLYDDPSDDNMDDEYDAHDYEEYAEEQEHGDVGEDEGAPIAEDEGAQNHEGAPIAEDEGAQHYDEDEGAHDENAAAPGYNLRPRNPDATNRFLHAIDNPHSATSYFPPTQLFQVATKSVEDLQDPGTMRRLLFAITMTQMSERKGLQKHGQAAEDAMEREFQQLDDLSVFEPLHAHELTPEQRKGSLRAINLIKEKRDGSLKGRTVADGSKQRGMYEKSQTASPTVSSDALITSVIIDAKERRSVATCDVVGAYLKATMKEFVVLKFTGKAVDILCKMNPRYELFVATENEKRILYVQLAKALYGHIMSALLWYNLFADTLVEMGFVLNPYDQCVANRDFNGKQCTIAWYVDDMKVSHVDPDVVTSVITNIESSFGKMTVTRGKEHEFLGMKIRYNDDETATFDMSSYLREALIESEMNIKSTATTPAKHNLFEVDEESPLLNKHYNEVFHRISAKLLYVATRARMDILLPVCFLCTRVSKSTEQDARKLRRVLEYVNGTLDLVYTVGADDLTKMRTWVDASYAVHPDMKSHTGGVISLGTGGIICKSTKQKLNTKSSTEAELVGASDYLPNTLWLKMFLGGQGYTVEENIFEQDNESAIKMEKNGRQSAGPKSRHINIRYFWIKDRIKSEGIDVRHCPTLRMIADFFTKPLQGSLFLKLRDVIMGHKHVSTLEGIEHLLSEERVGSCPSVSSPILNCDGKYKGRNIQKIVAAAAASDGPEKTARVPILSKTVTWSQVVKDGFESSFSRNNPVVIDKI